ncbi:MAG TPA: glycosyltransferase family 4 protein [Micropepsaceae bacterium]|nr:glycosyltransferase family 4 protein [Micropepsaceae bacterium]
MSVPVLFYAPMKPPGAFPPSGDTHLAALFAEALMMAGFSPSLASRLKTYDGAGDAAFFAQLEAHADREAARIVADPALSQARLFFTYHCYHKAPDLIGPRVARALNIPYVIAEGSRALKQRQGKWAHGFAAADVAFAAADLVLAMTSRDAAGLVTLADLRVEPFRPFIHTERFAVDDRARAAFRESWRARLSLPSHAPMLLAAAMMRPGKKQAGFDDLFAIMRALETTPVHDAVLVLAGGGAAETAIRALMAPLGARVSFAGLQPRDDMAGLYAASDLHIWPGRNEAFGLSYLEAAAAGTPSIAFDQAGVGAVVAPGKTGALVPPFDHAAFAGAVAQLVGDRAALRALSAAAQTHVRTCHDISSAAAHLVRLLSPLVSA